MSQEDPNDYPSDTLRGGDCDSREAPVLVEGARIHRYHILELIGRGGMGAVYKAYDPELDRRIAIKILALPRLEDNSSQARIKREAKALARLNHPNVVAVFDVGTYNDCVYIAMEYVEGTTLRKWLEDHTPCESDIIDVFVDAGRGLQAAHAQGIVHRDFKPDNLIVSNDGRVKILDFGLATAVGVEDFYRGGAASPSDSPSGSPSGSPSDTDYSSSDPSVSSRLTAVGTLLGTIAYMAPEHFLKQELDDKTDQFSYCVSLFEALYGRRPFTAKTTSRLERNVLAGRISIPEDATVPAWIQRILVRGLSVSKADRYPSMGALLSDLQDDPQIKRAQRKRKWLLLAAVLVAAALPFAVWSWFFSAGELCQGGRDKLGGVWDDNAKNKIKIAFEKTSLSYARDTYQRVVEHLDQYTGDWLRVHADNCRATRIRGEQSETMLDLRMVCLSKLLDELKTLNELLGEADATTVEKAIPAIKDLPALSTCTNVELLSDLNNRIKPPALGKQAEQVGQIQQQLNKAKMLHHTGNYRQGDSLAQQVLASAREADYPPLLAEAEYWSGMLKQYSGQFESAIQLFDQALFSATKIGYDEFAALAGSQLMYVIGYHQNRFEEGERMGRYSEAILQKLHDNGKLANLYGSMGVVLWAKGDWLQAKDKLNRSLDLLNRIPDASPMAFAKVLTNLGIVYFDEGDFDKAEELYTKALEIDIQTLGPEHPNVAISYNNLGNAVSNKGECAKAIEYHSRAFAICSKALGPDHLEVAYSHTNLGAELVLEAEYDEAKEHYQRALEIRTKGLGPNHPSTAVCLAGLANVASSQGDYPTAIKFYTQAVEIFEKALGPDHPHVARSLNPLAAALFETGQTKKAHALFQRALAIAEKSLRTGHLTDLSARIGLGEIYLQQNETERAVRYFTTVIDYCREHPCRGPKAAPLAHAQFGLAKALRRERGDRSLSNQLAQSALGLLEMHRSVQARATRKEIMEFLTELY